jgi:NAD(P)-dependent dehydrogenase (short-subunit alcohol dehydrogenase family)
VSDALLQDRTAVITGAGSGLGRATALLLAEHGATVVVADIDADAALRTGEEIALKGGRASSVGVDVSDSGSVAAMVQHAIETHGRLDCAVNNAALPPDDAPLDELDEARFDAIIAVNLRGVAVCLKHEMRAMRAAGGGGAIVNIGSTRSFRATATLPAYTASKFAVIGLTESAALSGGPDDIRVNAVCPGVMETPMVAKRRAASAESLDDYIDRVGGVLHRIGKPEEIAQAVLWLCSDQSSYVTGHTLVVDGGYLAR